MKVLVINAGSSSLKYQLFDMRDEQVLAKGLCERIGLDGTITHKPQLPDKRVFKANIPLPDHATAIVQVMEKMTSADYGVISDFSEIAAVGHRVVHGGELFSCSTLVTSEVLGAIEDCIPLAPLHNPANITGIRACQTVLGDIPQIAVFDTAFHQTMKAHAYTYALPYKYYEKYQIRRYGFHGTSHRFVAVRAAEMLGRPLSELKLISCHMGNGCSLCAVDGGKSVDTSMGFTPIEGIPMGTRCGDIDAGILAFLMQSEQLNSMRMLNVLNKESGIWGISGVSSDFRDVEFAALGVTEMDGDMIDAAIEPEDSPHPRAALALKIFRYSVTKRIGAYAAAMGGLDAVIFTAGLGENSASDRAAICENLGVLGLELDRERNCEAARSKGCEFDISIPGSRGKILVIPTNEELVIARDTMELISQ